MATIGKFTKDDNGNFFGNIITLSVQEFGVTIRRSAKDHDRAPDFRFCSAGGIEFGAGWSKTSREGVWYMSCKIDDPSFSAPVYASITEDGDGETYNMIWSR